MNIQPARKRTERKLFFYISAVMFSGMLLLAANVLLSTFAAAFLVPRLGEEWFQSELNRILTEMILQIIMLLIPGFFLLIVFRKNPLSGFGGSLSAPELPFLYVPMTIGFLLFVNFIVNIVFEDLLVPFDTPVTADMFPQTPVGILLYFVHVCIIPAVFEEWLFRGVMQKNLIPLIGKTPAILLSAFVFGLAHTDPAQSVFAFGFGIFVGYAFERSGSIWFGALIHMLNNAISVGASYWMIVYESEPATIFFGALTLILILVGIITFPLYFTVGAKRRKPARMTVAERALPNGKTVFRLWVCNPCTYLLIGSYVFLLWLIYFVQ